MSNDLVHPRQAIRTMEMVKIVHARIDKLEADVTAQLNDAGANAEQMQIVSGQFQFARTAICKDIDDAYEPDPEHAAASSAVRQEKSIRQNLIRRVDELTDERDALKIVLNSVLDWLEVFNKHHEGTHMQKRGAIEMILLVARKARDKAFDHGDSYISF